MAHLVQMYQRTFHPATALGGGLPQYLIDLRMNKPWSFKILVTVVSFCSYKIVVILCSFTDLEI